jgi:hypothetical protein
VERAAEWIGLRATAEAWVQRERERSDGGWRPRRSDRGWSSAGRCRRGCVERAAEWIGLRAFAGRAFAGLEEIRPRLELGRQVRVKRDPTEVGARPAGAGGSCVKRGGGVDRAPVDRGRHG